MTSDRVRSPRRSAKPPDRNVTAQRVLGGQVTNGGGGAGSNDTADSGSAQMLARVGHPAETVETVSEVSTTEAQMVVRREGEAR